MGLFSTGTSRSLRFVILLGFLFLLWNARLLDISMSKLRATDTLRSLECPGRLLHFRQEVRNAGCHGMYAQRASEVEMR
jgi:hypothetical protein